MTKVLITGASGFIGGHLAERLIEQGNELRCLVRKTSNVENLPAAKIEFVYGDLRDEAALANAVSGVEVVYHLAAMTSALRSADLLEANARGTERIAAACAAQPNPPVLVAVSSIAASGPIERGSIRTEDDAPAPVSDYGHSKLAGETACREFAAHVPTTIVRAAIVFGSRNKEMLPILKTIRRLRVHAIPTYRPPPLSYVHIDDLVELMIRAASDAPRLPPAGDTTAPAGQGIYFASMDEHPDYAEFGRMLRVLLGRPFAPMLHLPAFAAYPIAGINQSVARLRGKPDSFNIDKIREATASSWACSGEAARRDLGLEMPKSMQQRLAETVAWYREAGWL